MTTKKKCLVCLINPAYKCNNCGATLCGQVRTKICTEDVCPDRPLYGGKDGHYYVPIGKRPHLLMSKPLVIKMKPRKHTDCECC